MKFKELKIKGAYLIEAGTFLLMKEEHLEEIFALQSLISTKLLPMFRKQIFLKIAISIH